MHHQLDPGSSTALPAGVEPRQGYDLEGMNAESRFSKHPTSLSNSFEIGYFRCRVSTDSIT